MRVVEGNYPAGFFKPGMGERFMDNGFIGNARCCVRINDDGSAESLVIYGARK